jgi:hypothetical protein
VEVRHAPGEGAVAEQARGVLPAALREARRWGAVPPAITLTIHATHGELEAATGRAGNPWMRAWARPGAVDLQSPATWTRGYASDAALTQILAHELTHCVLFQAAGRDGSRDVPLWFQEGMASVAARERHSVAHPDAIHHPASVIRAEPRLFYGTADRAFRALVHRFGESRVRALLARLGEGRGFAVAFRDALGVAVADFEGDLGRELAALAVHP